MLTRPVARTSPGRVYVPKETLIRVSKLTRPSPIIVTLVACDYILVSGQELPKSTTQILWLSIRKFLAVDDLELQTMCFDCSRVSSVLRGRVSKVFSQIDERDALRCGQDAVRMFEWVARVLSESACVD